MRLSSWRRADRDIEFDLRTGNGDLVRLAAPRPDDAPTVGFSYTHLNRLLFEVIDPTYDKIDQDSDFFLEFIAEHANTPTWIHNVCERWTSWT